MSRRFLKIAFVLIIGIIISLTLNIDSVKETAKSVRDSINPYFPIGPLVAVKNPNEIPFPHKNDAVIFIHDIAPEYEPYIKQITDIINEYGFQKYTYLFLITFHHGKYNIENYPKFVSFLKKLRSEGYHIEFHAYLHEGAEFDCDYETAVSKIEISEGILQRCGFVHINLFFPPHGKVSRSAIRAFLQKNISVITKRILLVPKKNEIKAYSIDNQEFCWYITEKNLGYKIQKAEKNYETAEKERELFCLSVHPKAVNTKAGLQFLKTMLAFFNAK